MSEQALLTKQDAESVGLGLNLLFNNAQLFGPEHPSTGSAAEELAKTIRGITPTGKTVSLLKNGESFYVEKHVVDHRINVNRTSGQFLKLGIESLTFGSEVSGIDLRFFIQLYSDANSGNGDADSLIKGLEDHGITEVHINYITLKKVTKDQKIIDDDGLLSDINSEGTGTGSVAIPRRDINQLSENELDSHVFDRLGKLFSINDVVSGSTSFTDSVLGSFQSDGGFPGAFGTSGEGTDSHSQQPGSGVGGWGIPKIKEQFKLLNIEVEQGKAADGGQIDYDQLFESLMEMSGTLKENLKMQEHLESISEVDEVISEIDKLSLNTVIQIVVNEYKNGNTSIKRLSFLVKRVAPSKDELKKMLPLLKKALIEEGMPVADFLELTLALDRELSSDSALDGLFKEADDFGVSRDELVQAIKNNPVESTKLLLQAAEIEQKTGIAGVNISDYLSKMIEEVSTSIAEEKARKNETGDVHSILSDVVSTVEKNIVEQLKRDDKGEKIADHIEEQLSKRFPKTLDKLKTEWVVNTLGNSEDLSQEGILTILNSVATNQEEIERYKDSVSLFRQKFGFSENEITNILSNAKARQAAEEERKNVIILPPKNTVHMIKRYIEEYVRHKHSFSIIVASSDHSKEGYTFPEEVGLYVSRHFRFLDIAGYIRLRGIEMAVVILPMTDAKGLDIILPRFKEGIAQGKAKVTAASVDIDNPVEGYEQLMKTILRKHVQK